MHTFRGLFVWPVIAECDISRLCAAVGDFYIGSVVCAPTVFASWCSFLSC